MRVLSLMSITRESVVSEDISPSDEKRIEGFNFVTARSNDGIITVDGVDHWEIEKSTKLKKVEKK